jgi:inorganic pyrophosphatase/exopolyphosphatase
LDKTGKNLSHWSIKRLAKKFGLSWKRIRKSLKSKRDINEFNKAKSELEARQRVAMKNAKNENKAESNTKASDSDIEVFKRLVNIDLIDEEKNIKKVVKLETNEVATKTDSSFRKLLSIPYRMMKVINLMKPMSYRRIQQNLRASSPI